MLGLSRRSDLRRRTGSKRNPDQCRALPVVWCLKASAIDTYFARVSRLMREHFPGNRFSDVQWRSGRDIIAATDATYDRKRRRERARGTQGSEQLANRERTGISWTEPGSGCECDDGPNTSDAERWLEWRSPPSVGCRLILPQKIRDARQGTAWDHVNE